MVNKSPILLSKTKKILSELSENIKLARLRRKFSCEQDAERAGIVDQLLFQLKNDIRELYRLLFKRP